MKRIITILFFLVSISIFAYDIPEDISSYSLNLISIEQLKCLKQILDWENIIYKTILFVGGLLASLIFAVKWKV